MTFQTLEHDLGQILGRLAAQGYEARELVFDPPASETDIRRVEAELGLPLPSALRDVLTTVSRHVEFGWSAPGGLEFPPPFAGNFGGDLCWCSGLVLQCEEKRRGWIKACFADPEDAYDSVWHDKLAFQDVGNGDLLAIDLRPRHLGQVVYLSHDDGEGHGTVMAPSFRDLIERWVPLACTGSEDWQWLPFLGAQGIDPAGDNGQAWRRLLKIA